MKSEASFPHRVCISWLNRKISSACAAVRPDVKTERPTCTPTSCPVPDGGASVGTDTSAPKPWLAGADPLPGSKDVTVTELRTGQLGAAGGNKNDGGGGRLGKSGRLHSRDLPLSVLRSLGRGRSADWSRSVPISRQSRLRSASRSCSDLSRSSRLPAAVLTGRR